MPCRPILFVASAFHHLPASVNFAGRRARAGRSRSHSRPRLSGTMSIRSTRTTTSCTSSTSPMPRPGSFSRPTFRCWTARTKKSKRSTTSAGGPSARRSSRRRTGSSSRSFCPTVGWAGKHNSINCAAGHHLHEGRWLNDPRYLDDYSLFWFRKGGSPRSYSFWAADSLWARAQVTGDDRLLKELLPDLIANYEAWEKEHRGSQRPVLADR